jgi:hypothetical protein
MFLLKKLIFKLMELGLGLRTCFSLETRNPIFVNFELSEEEARRVQQSLPSGVRLEKIRFCDHDGEPAYWISYNLYEIRYPKKELERIRKVRCEINTFVRDAEGRRGVYVFCGSPYVSREEKPSLLGKICDFAERLVIFIYGCGKLTRLGYELTEKALRIELSEGKNTLSIERDIAGAASREQTRLSDEYQVYNDISFFNEARTFDLVNVNSAFLSARFEAIGKDALGDIQVRSPFFHRSPDRVYFHRGDIAYLVSSMNRSPRTGRRLAQAT